VVVQIAADSAKPVEMARRVNHDLILMDLQMPVIAERGTVYAITIAFPKDSAPSSTECNRPLHSSSDLCVFRTTACRWSNIGHE